MNIKDRDVRNAIETLITEFENSEEALKEAEENESDSAEQIEKLEAQVQELESRVEELEEALAEAYLTSEKDNEDKDDVQTGSGSDVSNSADDEEASG